MVLSLDLTKRYSVADYLAWLDDVRREFIDGFIHFMAEPTFEHADICWNIASNLKNTIKDKGCNWQVFCSPVDVCLPKNGETNEDKIFTVVQPDNFVVCDKSKRRNDKCYGVTDMIVEILSPTIKKKDLIIKHQLYEKVVVKEYWVANSKLKSMTVYFMQENGEYDESVDYASDETFPLTYSMDI